MDTDETSLGLKAFQEAIYELEQMITVDDVECNYYRNEIQRNNGKMTKEVQEQFLLAKAKAVQRFIKTLIQ